MNLLKIGFLFLFVFALLKVPKNYHRLTGGFRLSSCELSLENKPSWNPKSPSDETLSLLHQPFFFLKRGSQAYVFISEDKKYVLKLFAKPLKYYRFQRYTRPKKPNPDLRFQTEKALRGYHLAQTLPEEATGLVYLHLNPTENLLPSVSFKDAFHRTYTIQLDSYRFAIQKTCDLLAPTLQKLARQNDLETIEKLKKSYLEKIAFRASLGIRNTDTEFKKNFGHLEDSVIEFDVGEYCLDPNLLTPEGQREEIALFGARFDSWLKKQMNSP